MTIKRYRERVEQIEAMQLGPSPDDLEAAIEFCAREADVKLLRDPDSGQHVIALDGEELVVVGQWIVRREGFVGSMTEERFAETYEPLDAA